MIEFAFSLGSRTANFIISLGSIFRFEICPRLTSQTWEGRYVGRLLDPTLTRGNLRSRFDMGSFRTSKSRSVRSELRVET